MISDLELAQACNDSYDVTATWWRLSVENEVWVALRQLPGGMAVVFRGSDTPEDWLRDFRGWPKRHPVLGYCHEGFLEGMDDVGAWVATSVPHGAQLAITGHSLGAARALVVAGLLTAAGRAIERVVTFGTPRPGFARLSWLINGGGYPITCYKNRHDVVTDVPFLQFVDGDGYQRPVAQTALNVDGGEPPLMDHHMPLYLEGVRQTEPSAAMA